ncbi:MAG TPA: alpha/beta fold hydrolase [Rhodocyclaceae bacterium]|nr:alpha/beta fold hydrolase [Rhodocyclaceae bacterium]
MPSLASTAHRRRPASADFPPMDTPHRFDRHEVLMRLPQGAARPTPLLFVHGAFTAAWCWDEHFLPFFADAGYASYAISLSGHGASPGREHLDMLSIDDYVRDLATVIEQLPAPPVLIGHSMGGFVVQKYLEEQIAPGAVLMCSVPPQGLMSAAMGMMFARPALLVGMSQILTGGRAALETLRDMLFAQPIDMRDLKRYLRGSQQESSRAIWDMSLFAFPRTERVKRTPLLVQGAECDHLTSAALAEITARCYGVKAQIFSGMGHGLMLERDWRLPAQHMLDWLQRNNL